MKQMLKVTPFVIAFGIASIALPALARVPENVANRLGRDLTPIGAERAGSKSGIPAWSPANRIDHNRYLSGDYEERPLPDPFVDDKILYTITASNAANYKKALTEGQLKMFATYPGSYKINAYRSRRTCVFPDIVYEGSVRNAKVGELVDDGNGISEAFMSSPFPIPNSGLEIVWNHTLRYRGVRLARDFNFAAPTRSGDYTLTFTRDEVWFPYSDPTFTRAEDLNNISIYFIANTTAPARNAGNVVLVHETLNMASEGRKAWTYSPGTRRVRRAPNIAYDNPLTNGDGLASSDQYDGYNGAPDRYDWRVVGKVEKLSQQNNYRATHTPYNQLLKGGHTNPDAHRYELRRLWQVEGNLKETARHIYARRVFRFDEDSWQLANAEMYDGRGELWRIQEIGQAPDYRPESNLCFTTGGEFVYDILAGRYIGLAMKSDRPLNLVNKGLNYLKPSYYTPASIRRLGR